MNGPSALHVERLGSGPDLVLLHGWGLHGGIFHPLAEQMGNHFTLHLVDLPGHGLSPPPHGPHTLASLAGIIAGQVPEQASWLGWSLGGRIALAACAQGHAIHKLILTGSNPCFLVREDWPHGMAEDEFSHFAESVRKDWRATLQRFLVLQTRGSAHGRDELRELREAVFAHGQPDPAALEAALDLLQDTDLRSILPAIRQSVLAVHGARDTLTPVAAAEYMARQLPDARLHIMATAGHAPFLSHRNEFSRVVREFLA